MRREAHTLKGSAAIFAAKNVTDLASRIESLARDNNLEQAGAVAQKLELHVQSMVNALEEYVGSS